MYENGIAIAYYYSCPPSIIIINSIERLDANITLATTLKFGFPLTVAIISKMHAASTMQNSASTTGDIVRQKTGVIPTIMCAATSQSRAAFSLSMVLNFFFP